MQNLLVIHPLDPAYTPDSPALIPGALAECGMIMPESGQARNGPVTRLEIGPRFVRYISFLGCSPTLIRDGETLIYMEYPGIKSNPQFLAHPHPHPGRCPQCRSKSAELPEPRGWAASLHCPQCGLSLPCWQWDWQHRAGWARTWVAVYGISEGIAVPSDLLLELLGKVSGASWGWLYQ